MEAFSMHGQAQIWWGSKGRELTTSGEVITRDMFFKKMQNNYIPTIVKDRKAFIFYNLVQGIMTVIDYESKFEMHQTPYRRNVEWL